MWEQFLHGDSRAYAWLYDNYVLDLFRYGMRINPDREFVKDCIQDVFTYLYRNRQRLSVPDNVKAYLFVCLKHNMCRLLRKESAFRCLDPATMSFRLEPAIEDRIIEEEDLCSQRELIDRIMSQLTARQHEIIYYRFIERMSYKDICALMGLNYQSAQNLIQRSLKRIRSLNTPVRRHSAEFQRAPAPDFTMSRL